MEKKKNSIRLALMIALLAGGVGLIGCNNRAETLPLKPVQEQGMQAMQQSWRGIIPCADCAGIETSLFLAKDGTWVMNEYYQGARGKTSAFASYGRWARTADRLTLTDTRGKKSYFRVTGEQLEMLDSTGNRIDSALNYTLAPVRADLPLTPMPMRGKYRYMADSATFTDCVTGRVLPVNNNVQLERGYAAAGGQGMEGVMVEFNAHYRMEPNMDTGVPEKTVVPDGHGTFRPGEHCAE
ncbi:copper homeostasis protein CutF precursor [Shimwellia blattae DSM 4481 = NBRC 105725]|uniref:Copper homeostasis protein CutF n=2 Tax=Shimwellia blattae TaxID=563 RepID=I2BCH8_SHIBC|nr:copper homeostasis protein CutF precursor [Shimwellia blattae DSM 4481 = NBRC 105725]GAB80927.1 lipoprotein NlpE [Shimwellia blattae DSM 4481 = NBRC 105725]VDY65727.1 Copper homeostasis protein CutF [Shimwellia blattae]VEC25531.1 Copper homeostasis protein CutF [Shimwellia blattae]